MSDGGGGGQIYLDGTAQWVNVSDNYIDGNNWATPTGAGAMINGCYAPPTSQGVFGIEADVGSANNALLGNEIERNTGGGITVAGVASIHISGYAYYGTPPNNPRYIHGNVGNNPPHNINTRGIEIINNSTGIKLDGILSINNTGEAVYLQTPNVPTGVGWLNGHCLSSLNTPTYVTSTSLTNPTPSNTVTCP
jgi:hypothetical protein